MAKLIFTDAPAGAITELVKAYTSVFLLADLNTKAHCFPLLKEIIPLENSITIPAGEASKSMDSCLKIWEVLSDRNADRNSLLINLGGGMVTDLGGFAASTYKRGIDFINIPTSLLGIVDASIGGKTGINFNYYKNQVGSFSDAKAVVVHSGFLKTLPERELFSGYAEMLKYGLIADNTLWENLSSRKELNLNDRQIKRCIEIKEEITAADPREKARRKVLNFGHTIGHAFESYAMMNNTDLLHGEAVAAGMIAESYLSMKKGLITDDELEEITIRLHRLFGTIKINEIDFDSVINIMRQDKKNSADSFRFVLLESIGSAIYDVDCSAGEIHEALDYYTGLNKA